MKLLRLVGIVTVLVLQVNAHAQDADFAAFIERGMDMWHVPGAAAAVLSDDAVVFSQGFGTTAIDGGGAVDEHTAFAIASTTKAMVAMGILILVDDGKLSLDDPITMHLPELHFSDPFMDREITVRDLLAHRTGLPSTNTWSFMLDMPLDEQIQRLRYVERDAGIRTRSIYQNTMYDLLGLLFERLAGRAWYEFLEDELWRPIGMEETWSAREDIPEDVSRVTPHFFKDGDVREVAYDLPAGDRMPAGSVWSTLHDMGLWAQFLLRGGVTAAGNRLVSEAQYKQMFEPTQFVSVPDFYPAAELTRPHWRTYGLAWYQQDFQGRMIDFHTGSLAGLIAIIGLDREAKRAVLMLANRDHAEFRHAWLWRVMDETSGDRLRDWNQDIFDLYQRNSDVQEEERRAMYAARRKGTSTSVPLEQFAGTYSAPAFGDIEFRVEDGELVADLPLQQVRFSHWHANVFLWRFEQWDFEMLVEFRIGFDNSVTALEWGRDTFVKVDQASAP